MCGFVRATLCTTSTVQDYVVHRGPTLCTMVHKGDLIIWCTWWFVVFIITYQLDGAKTYIGGLPPLSCIVYMFFGAQYNVVSLAVASHLVHCSISLAGVVMWVQRQSCYLKRTFSRLFRHCLALISYSCLTHGNRCWKVQLVTHRGQHIIFSGLELTIPWQGNCSCYGICSHH